MTSNSNEVFTGGASTSQHVDAEDDDHFENTTFKLKRTRSLGLLDEFINPLEKEKNERNKVSQQSNDSVHNKVPNDQSSLNDTESNFSKPHNEDYDENLNTNNTNNTTDNDDNDDNNSTDGNSKKSNNKSTIYKSPELLPHDDTDISMEPSRHVDYFSHQWDVSDISKSWRYIIQKRKDVANSSRLENASWRTWAQRRLNLKTINPELLNWSKENDITWLYGPILKDEDHESSDDDVEDHKRITTATSKVAGDISIPNTPKGQKGILKKRSVQDQIISHSNLLKLELMENRLKASREQKRKKQIEARNHRRTPSNEPPEFDDYEAISEKLNSQYRVGSAPNSSVNLAQLSSEKENTESNTDTNVPDTDAKSATSSKKERRIHFNDEVKQCIALDPDSEDEFRDEYEDDDDEYYDDNDYNNESYIYSDSSGRGLGSNYSSEGDEVEDGDDEEEEEDEDGGFFLKVKSPSSSNLAPTLVNRDKQKQEQEQSQKSQAGSENSNTVDTESISTAGSRLHPIIQLLPSTALNYGSDDESSDEDNPYTSSVSHNVHNNSSRGYDYYYDYNTVYTVDPTHGIYGNSKDNSSNQPDVVDLPEDLAQYSNYDTVDSDNSASSASNSPNVSIPIMDSSVRSANTSDKDNSPNESIDEPMELNISSTPVSDSNSEDSGSGSGSGSDSDSDSDEGLSIATRTSSQSLAQLVYNQNNMTPIHNYEELNDSHYPSGFNPSPVDDNMDAMNPRYSSTGMYKQSTSSNSLSDQFFGTTPLNKESSHVSLSDQFFGNTAPMSMNDEDEDDNNNKSKLEPETQSSDTPSDNTSSTNNKALPQTQSKSYPLPPFTTSANAFRGTGTSCEDQNTKPPVNKNNTFSFDSDSDESEDEENEDVADVPAHLSMNLPSSSHTPCYDSLSQVAGRNGINSPSPDIEGNDNQKDKKLVDQAKGLANHFLGKKS